MSSQEIKRATERDPILSKVSSYTMQGWPRQLSPSLHVGRESDYTSVFKESNIGGIAQIIYGNLPNEIHSQESCLVGWNHQGSRSYGEVLQGMSGCEASSSHGTNEPLGIAQSSVGMVIHRHCRSLPRRIFQVG